MNQADENISLRESIVYLPQVYLKKKKKKETVYIYPLQFNRKFSLQSGSGLKCQHGQEDMLDLITASSTVLFIEDVIVSTCRNLRQT